MGLKRGNIKLLAIIRLGGTGSGRGGRVVRWSLVNFQCRGVLQFIFSLLYLFSPLSPILWETARYRLKYSLKGPLNPKQPTSWVWSAAVADHNYLYVQQMILIFIYPLMLFRSGCRKDNADAITSGSKKMVFHSTVVNIRDTNELLL